MAIVAVVLLKSSNALDGILFYYFLLKEKKYFVVLGIPQKITFKNALTASFTDIALISVANIPIDQRTAEETSLLQTKASEIALSVCY